jgi:hypothetical protein
MAIVHVAFKSSSTAPPAAAHAQYIARDGQYERRGGVELVESGNMPEFAEADPFAFWAAADAHERSNGRTYTELQIALPRELAPAQRHELAREATRALLGDRFAYTLAVHVPLAKDNIDQPHMHLMFSERIVDERTRAISEEQFFKRNGAKKDRETWHSKDKPEEVREKWVAMMNGAMERAGIEQRMDARSWADQGREDLAELREPKLLGGEGQEAVELRNRVEELRERRAGLPAPHLDQAAAVQQIERETQRAIAEVEQRRDREIGLLEEWYQKARELAVEVKERVVSAAQKVSSILHQPEKDGADVLERARQLREASPERAEFLRVQVLCADHKERETDLKERLREWEQELSDWKKTHPVQALRSVFGQDVSRLRLESAIGNARQRFNDHQAEFQADYDRLPRLEAKLKAAWPETLQQARRDLKEVSVPLQPEQVRELILEAYGQDKDAGMKLYRDVLERRSSITLAGPEVRIEREKEGGLTGHLKAMHQPALDRKLLQLERRRVDETKKVVERENIQPVRASSKEPSRAELDRQLREIAARAGYAGKPILEPADEKRKEATGRVLGYTRGNEEALFRRLTGGLVRLDMRGKELHKVGKEIDVNLLTGDISKGMSRS